MSGSHFPGDSKVHFPAAYRFSELYPSSHDHILLYFYFEKQTKIHSEVARPKTHAFVNVSSCNGKTTNKSLQKIRARAGQSNKPDNHKLATAAVLHQKRKVTAVFSSGQTALDR